MLEGCNIFLLGPPGTAKTHLATALGVKACNQGHRVLSASATNWVNRLTASYRSGTLAKDLAKLRRYPLLIVEEVGYIPFETEAANLFFQLFSSRFEHASLILTSNLPFSGWGEVLGNHVVASDMIDRIVHHVEVITLKGNSYRLKNTKTTLPSERTRARQKNYNNRGPHFIAGNGPLLSDRQQIDAVPEFCSGAEKGTCRNLTRSMSDTPAARKL